MEITMKKIISGILAIIMLLSITVIFSACGGNKDNGDGAGTTTAEPPFPGILVSDVPNIKIIYSSTDTQPVAKQICDAMEKKFGFRPAIRSSYVNNAVAEFAEAEFEILVGNCENREESESLFATVRIRDYGYSLVNKKIVVAGGSVELIRSAAEAFVSNVIEKCDSSAQDSFFFKSESNFMQLATYAVDSIKLNDSYISEYTIIYPESDKPIEKSYANSLAAKIEGYSGYTLRIKSDALVPDKSAKEIRIGVTDRNTNIAATAALGENGYYVGKASDGAIEIYATSITGYIGAIEKIYAMAVTGEKAVNMSITEAIKGTNASEALTMMSFNILTTKPSDARFAAVVKRITDVMPDTVGLQEVSPYWMSKIKPELEKVGYECVGVDRNGDGSGEYSCIFYLKDKFTLKDSGTKWLSDTPDKVSRYPEAAYNRIFTYAKLQRKSDGKTFIHVNTHLDHVGGMHKQAKVLTSFADQMGNVPILFTGDFNSEPGSAAYKVILEAGYSNLALVAADTDDHGTFYKGTIIDYFFGNSLVFPEKYDVNYEGFEGTSPSDHYPLILKYYI